MTGLNDTQKEAIGLNFIINRLSCKSPYGKASVRNIRFFGRTGKEQAERCFDNIDMVVGIVKKSDKTADMLLDIISRFKNIEGIVKKCESGNILNEVELFEIKGFLLLLEDLIDAYNCLGLLLNGIKFDSMKIALDILDPDGRRIAPFFIDEKMRPALRDMRKEKERLEAAISKSEGEDKTELLRKRADICALEDDEERAACASLSHQLRQYIKMFYDNMDNIGKLDLLFAKALLAVEYNAMRPKIADCISLKNMYNPFIEENLAQKGRKMTKTSIILKQGVAIITGANMGGKSVAMVTTVLNASLCQLGFFVFSEYAEIPLFDGIYFTSGDMQDMGRGLSSFGAEIMHLKEILKHIETDFLFIALDEPARTTNPSEGAAIVRGLAAFLAEAESISLINTHYDQVLKNNVKYYRVAGLTDDISDRLALRNKESLSDIGDYMDYRLIEADSGLDIARDGLNICRIAGLDDKLMGRIEDELRVCGHTADAHLFG